MPNPTAQPINDRIRDLFVGSPVQHESLTVVPLHDEPVDLPPRAYIMLGKAVGEAAVEIEERDGGGSVPVMRVTVKGDRPVLLVEGEILVGGKQNRILNTSVLAAGEAVTEIPVSCVEQGRWSAPRSVGTSRATGSPTVRGGKCKSVTQNIKECKSYASDQGKVWKDVETTLIATGTSSPTTSFQAAYETNADRLTEVVEAMRPVLEGGPHPRPVGLAAFIGGKIVAVDIFDRFDTFGELAPKLLEGYALDAIRTAAGDPLEPGAAREETIAFLDRVTHAKVHSEASPGLGTDHRLEDEKVAGFALEHEGKLLHLAAFPA